MPVKVTVNFSLAHLTWIDPFRTISVNVEWMVETTSVPDSLEWKNWVGTCFGLKKKQKKFLGEKSESLVPPSLFSMRELHVDQWEQNSLLIPAEHYHHAIKFTPQNASNTQGA